MSAGSYETKKIAAQIAASYTLRELDRVWFDRFMATKAGATLKGLPRPTQLALEFVAYLSSALVIQGSEPPSAIRRFLYTVLADIPPEIAKRMMATDTDEAPPNISEVVKSLSDTDLIDLVAAGKSAAQELPNDATKPSFISELTSNIEEFRARTKAQRRIFKPKSTTDS